MKKQYKTGQNTLEWLKIDLPEKEECCSCKAIVDPNDKVKKPNPKNDGFSSTMVCPVCGSDEFYLYK